MRTMIFAKRNMKEIFRDPISLIFNFVFPLLMLVLFFCFIFGKSVDKIAIQTPMFLPKRIIPAISIFSFSFLTLFIGMLVSKDRSSSFISRLQISPLKSWEFFLGYLIPMLLIAIIQMIVTYIFGTFLSIFVDASIRFNMFSGGALLTFLLNIPSMILFISLGILFGCLVNDKAVGSMSSIIINVAAIFGGMFMPLNIMGGFKYVAQGLPFYHSITLIQDACNNSWPNSVEYFNDTIMFYKMQDMNVIYNILDTWYMHIIFVIIYTIIVAIVTIIVFKKKIIKN